MKVRKPGYDYSASLPHWSRSDPEFAQWHNVGSLSLPYLEGYLNAVMRRAQAQLGPEHPLNRDIALFCKQETRHYLEHGDYNQALHNAGYASVPEIERKFKDHFDHLLNHKSLKFNCAYSLGFETIGPIIAQWWFDRPEEIPPDADPVVVSLWKWHFAEEFEHRTVAYDVYYALYGGYFTRLKGLFSFIRDARKLNGAFVKDLLAEDYKKMSAEQIARSRRRLADYKKRDARFTLPRILRALSPFYTPRGLKEPRGVTEFLQDVSEASSA